MRLLLDVNVWVALFDDSHIHNADALALVAQPGLQIATCALTENGVLRVLNIPGYSRRAPPGFEAVREKLALVCDEVDHEFWACDVSLRDAAALNWRYIMGHNQISDAYLLALAVKHGGALATFDHRVTASAVKGATAKNLRHL